MARSLQSLVHWPSMVGQGSDGPICNGECQMLQPSCLISSQTSIFISAPQEKVSCGLPPALVLAPGLKPPGLGGPGPLLLSLLLNYHHPAVLSQCCWVTGPLPGTIGGTLYACPPYQPSFPIPGGLTGVLFSRILCETVGLCPVSGWLGHKGQQRR